MSEDIAETEPADGVRLYTLASLAALLGVAIPLLGRGVGEWALFPVLVGVLGVLFRWRAGPVLTLLALLWLVLADRERLSPWGLAQYMVSLLLTGLLHLPSTPIFGEYSQPRLEQLDPFLDLVLGVSLVVYLAAHMRLLACSRNIFPVDRRRRRPPKEPARGERKGAPTFADGARQPVLQQPRSPEMASAAEVPPLLLLAVICGLVGRLLYVWVRNRDVVEDLADLARVGLDVGIRNNGPWRLVALVWLFALVLIPLTGVFAYFAQRRMSDAEAGLYLQDQVWRDTRREQARLNRWLAWASKQQARRDARRRP